MVDTIQIAVSKMTNFKYSNIVFITTYLPSGVSSPVFFSAKIQSYIHQSNYIIMNKSCP